MWEFNRYIYENFKSRVNPRVPFRIHHDDSCVVQELQVADLFSWGIYRKHEHRDLAWYDIFKDKILFEELYLG